MSPDLSPSQELRQAAEKIRADAEQVPHPWGLAGGDVIGRGYGIYPLEHDTWQIASSGKREWAGYLFSWHPGVALAVADWLDQEAAWYEQYDLATQGFIAGVAGGDPDMALHVARAYLGTGKDGT